MHSFVTDSTERKNVTLVLALLSIVVSLVLDWAARLTELSPPLWVDVPSVLAVFGFLYWTFDNWAWRWSIWRKIGLVKIPDLSGSWKGEITTSFDQNSNQYPIDVTIRQKWTRMVIALEANQSNSHSLTASLLTDHPSGVTLSYEYWNAPKATATSTMHAHEGTAVLKLKSDGVLEGGYYSGRDRQTYGSIFLQKNEEG